MVKSYFRRRALVYQDWQIAVTIATLPTQSRYAGIKREVPEACRRNYMHYMFLHDLCQYYLEYLFLEYCNFKIARAGLDYRPLIEELNLN